MAKTKRTIRKIRWDVERGVGVAQEYVPSDIPSSETHEEGVPFIVAEPPVSPEPSASAPSSFSPHVLDLRHVRVSSPIPFTRSRMSRFLSFLFTRQKKKPVFSQEPVAMHTHRFPAIDARAIAQLVQPRASRTSFTVSFSHITPDVLLNRFPMLTELSIGVVLVVCARLGVLFLPLFVRCASFVRAVFLFIAAPFRPARILWSTLRYYYRRIAIEFHSIFSLVHPVRSRLAFGVATADTGPASNVAFRRALAFFAIASLLLSAPFYAFSTSAAFINPSAIESQGKALLPRVTRALAAMEKGEWKGAREEWNDFRKESQALGDRVYLTNPVVGPLLGVFSARARMGRTALIAAAALADAGIAGVTLGEALSQNMLLTDRIVRMRSPFNDLLAAGRRLTSVLHTIDPQELSLLGGDNADRIMSSVGEVIGFMEQTQGLFTLLPEILGHDRPQRYLVLLQNDAEARATGGFIGSIGVLDLDHGAVRKIFMPDGGSYDLQGSLRVNYRSPEPLQYVNPRFEFQDANWWPDFPTSAKKLLFLWEKSGGPTVDGVIAVNASLFAQLIKIIGPIDMPAYKKRIDAENFFFETQKAVELEYDRKKNTPKKFLRDLAEAVTARMGVAERDTFPKLALTFLNALREKDVQLYAVNPVLEQQILRERVGGAVAALSPATDTLRIVRTNIAGGKTDHVLRDAVQHETRVEENGALIDRVTITRVHTGERRALFTGMRSRDYLRVYVPLRAELIDAEGFSLPTRRREVAPDEYEDDPDLASWQEGTFDAERRVWVMQEGDRTFFGGWVELDPGEVKTITLTYRLPFTIQDKPYRLSLEKQSGMRGVTVMHRTVPSKGSRIIADTFPSLTSPQPWRYDMVLLQSFGKLGN